MHKDDPKVFLNLAAALKMLFARSILVGDLERAKGLLENFLYGFLQVSEVNESQSHHLS